MVDLDFVAAKLIEREQSANTAAKNKGLGLMANIIYTIQMVYKTHNVEVCFELDSAKKFEAMLNAHLEAGFEKRVFQKKSPTNIYPNQQGTVVKIVPTDETWNNKKLWGVVVELDDGNETTVNVFDQKTFRKDDRVAYSTNAKGYPKLEHYGGEQDADDVPF